MTLDQKLQLFQQAIDRELARGTTSFGVYPYGMNGWLFAQFLESRYGIKPAVILDNKLCETNEQVKPLAYLHGRQFPQLAVFMTCENQACRAEILDALRREVPEDSIRDLGEAMLAQDKQPYPYPSVRLPQTKCGKYSNGPLTNHPYVESVGSFCSFAVGCDVQINHPVDFISTHYFLFNDGDLNPMYLLGKKYEDCPGGPWFFPGVKPMRGEERLKRVVIGNDVWVGKYALILNYANVADGAIVAGGAVVTKDVPPYAIVAGVPARIIRYRYAPKEIEALLRIAWWDWPDELIRERYADFYLPARDFIAKYGEMQA